MKKDQFLSAVAAASVVALAAASASAQPVNTTLPSGWTWQPVGSFAYDTGLVGTSRGGFNGQTTPPFNDTSFGIMDEVGAPWFDGSDLSAQQYVQRQIFGNFGTSSPPGPAGFRYFNFGYQMTAAGSNFPPSGIESRNITLNHWFNPLPDSGGVATLGQIVNVPTAATFTSGLGFGADELVVKAIGGVNANTTRVVVGLTISAIWQTAAFGGIQNLDNAIFYTARTTFNDPGAAFGNYDMPFGFGVGLGNGQIDLVRTGTVLDQNTVVGTPAQGIVPNSTGVGFTDTYNVLSSILQDGSPFLVQYSGNALVDISRTFGNADARASAGPGLEGNARLVVEYRAWRATPPGSCLGDHDLSGTVDFADITFALSNFGNPFTFASITETLSNFGADCSGL